MFDQHMHDIGSIEFVHINDGRTIGKLLFLLANSFPSFELTSGTITFWQIVAEKLSDGDAAWTARYSEQQ